MKYCIDHIENGIALLENIETGEKKEVKTEVLPIEIKEGNVVVEKETYEIDLTEEQKRRDALSERFNNLIE